MSEPKKKAHEMTSDELAHRVFPHEVVRELKRIAHEEPSKSRQPKGGSPSQPESK
jgi:hypothetical protein